jgi:hypothetical protein
MTDINRIMKDHINTLKELTTVRGQVNNFLSGFSELKCPAKYPPALAMAWSECYDDVIKIIKKELF